MDIEAKGSAQNFQHSNLIIDQLVREGVLDERQLLYISRIAEKLPVPRSLCEIVRELQFVTVAQIRDLVRRNQHLFDVGSLLVCLGLLSESALHRVQAAQGDDPLAVMLIRHKFISAQQLAETLRDYLALPLVQLSADMPDQTLLREVDPQKCRQYCFLPTQISSDGRILVTCVDPLDTAFRQTVARLYGANVSFQIATLPDLQDLLFEPGIFQPPGATECRNDGMQILVEIVESAVRAKASHIHIEPLADRVRVRFRVTGVMVQYRDFEQSCGVTLNGACRQKAAKALLHDDIQMKSHFARTPYGERVTLTLQRRMAALSLSQLGMFASVQERLAECLQAPGGLQLIAGSRASGCSTAILGCATRLNGPETNIGVLASSGIALAAGMTRFIHADGRKTSQSGLLREMVTQDLDVMVVDDAIDVGGIEICLHAVLAGRKVLVAVAGFDAMDAVLRLVHGGIDAYRLSVALGGVLGVRLARRICTQCAEPTTPDLRELAVAGIDPQEVGGALFMMARGCEECGYTGYAGQVGLHELVLPTEEFREALMAGKSSVIVDSLVRVPGYMTLLEDGLLKAVLGQTTLSEVLRVAPRNRKPRSLATLRTLAGV